MSQYVRLFTPSDYAQPQGQWTQIIIIAAVAAVMLIAGFAMLCTTAVIQKRRKTARAEAKSHQSTFQTDYFHHDDDDDFAITDTGSGMLGSLLVGIAFAFLAVCVSTSLCIMNNAGGYTGTRKGSLPADNMALVEQSYRLKGVEAETRIGENVDDYLATDNDPNGFRYLNVVAQSDDGSIRHLTLQIDRNSHLRVYEGTGDAQHLIVPVQSSSKGKTEP